MLNQEASTVASVLFNEFISRYGVPAEIRSDQGRNFESAVFTEMCQLLDIHKTRKTALHPLSDGMVERYNRTLGRQLAMFIGEHQDTWDQKPPLLLTSYRSAMHDTTGYTPSMLTYGREISLPVDLVYGRPGEEPVEYCRYLRDRLDSVQELARSQAPLTHGIAKRHTDLRAGRNRFEVGDPVWMNNPQRKKGLCPKLAKQWEGPSLTGSTMSCIGCNVDPVKRRSWRTRTDCDSIEARLLTHDGLQSPETTDDVLVPGKTTLSPQDGNRQANLRGNSRRR